MSKGFYDIFAVDPLFEVMNEILMGEVAIDYNNTTRRINEIGFAEIGFFRERKLDERYVKIKGIGQNPL